MCVTATPVPTGVDQQQDALVERLFGAALGAFDLLAIYLGDRLGYYTSLSTDGPATSAELAARTGTAERYAREWLEQQAVTGLLEVVDAGPDASSRRFAFPEAYRSVLLDPTDPAYFLAIARGLVAVIKPMEQLLEAYRTGGGVPFEEYGDDMLQGQAAMNRPLFTNAIASEWMPAMPDIQARLASGKTVRVADIGMGAGWSSIEMAKAYPNVLVDGFDLDHASVRAARSNAEAEGVADRVTFHVRDAGDADLAGQYDLATAFECVHDMSNPVDALRSMRRLVGEGGTVLIMDEKVADEFTAPGDDVERFMYGFSIVHCLPVGMVDQPSAGTGTVMRADTLRSYADQAGFQAVDILPIEHDFFRFYRLTA